MARAKTRKIIFHAGPTNSGKTYHALERFMTAKSGVYCGPLKLLAVEVFNKCNQRVSQDNFDFVQSSFIQKFSSGYCVRLGNGRGEKNHARKRKSC